MTITKKRESPKGVEENIRAENINQFDPLSEYRTYLRDVRGGMVGDMGFTRDDFKNVPANDRKPYGHSSVADLHTNFRLYRLKEIMIITVIVKTRIADERNS